jgi:hypothetical protein
VQRRQYVPISLVGRPRAQHNDCDAPRMQDQTVRLTANRLPSQSGKLPNSILLLTGSRACPVSCGQRALASMQGGSREAVVLAQTNDNDYGVRAKHCARVNKRREMHGAPRYGMAVELCLASLPREGRDTQKLEPGKWRVRRMGTPRRAEHVLFVCVYLLRGKARHSMYSTRCVDCKVSSREEGEGTRKTRGFPVVSLPDAEPALTRLARRRVKRKGVARVKGDSMVGRAEPIRYSD